MASWVSVVVAAVAAALELALAGAIPLWVALPAMASWHTLIGLGEGIITTAVLAYLARVRPSLLGAPRPEVGGATVLRHGAGTRSRAG